jgi:hypothetical protein
VRERESERERERDREGKREREREREKERGKRSEREINYKTNKCVMSPVNLKKAKVWFMFPFFPRIQIQCNNL